MNIIFVIENYYPYVGGVETLFKNLCEGLVKKGHKVAVVCSHLEGCVPIKGTNYERINGVYVHRVCTSNRFLFPLSSLWMVFRSAFKADIIHTSTYTGAFPAWMIASMFNIPCVITVHEILGARWKKFGFKFAWLLRILEWVIIQLGFNQYVGVSKSICNQIESLGKKAIYIYNGVDYEHWNPDKYEPIRLHNGFTYLYFGRAGISKGVQNLVIISDIVRELIPNSRLVMLLGKEPAAERAHIVSMIKEWGVEDHIILMNSVPYDMLPRYIKGADCVVVPSLSEGFGFSCAESCAMGVPLVASDVDSLPEVVSGKYRLAKVKWRSLAANIIKISAGLWTEAPLKKFEWKDCIDKYEQVYKELAK